MFNRLLDAQCTSLIAWPAWSRSGYKAKSSFSIDARWFKWHRQIKRLLFETWVKVSKYLKIIKFLKRSKNQQYLKSVCLYQNSCLKSRLQNFTLAHFHLLANIIAENCLVEYLEVLGNLDTFNCSVYFTTWVLPKRKQFVILLLHVFHSPERKFGLSISLGFNMEKFKAKS